MLVCFFALSFLLSGPFSYGASSIGYSVNNVAEGSTFEKLGIKAGDRILSYDGKDVTSLNDSMELFNKLKSKSVKTVVIERDGKKQTLNFQAR